MTHQPATLQAPGMADAGEQVARLQHVLALVHDVAGLPPATGGEGLDDAAKISGAYDAALTIVQKRFDDEAAITARWASAGLEALLRLTDNGWPVGPAARRLAAELERALAKLGRIVSA
ncbi:MAG: hypothetical protein JWO25_3274 [Alphaproteobacteria bacterium]|nr:hypothetical protein [Alphaproteobacteria bacterium]